MMNQYWYPFNNMMSNGFGGWFWWLIICFGFIVCFGVIAALIAYIISKK